MVTQRDTKINKNVKNCNKKELKYGNNLLWVNWKTDFQFAKVNPCSLKPLQE